MTAAEARARLEAAIWDTPPWGKITAADVDVILAAADAYAEIAADERITRMADDAAQGPHRLAVAAAEAFERKGER